MRKLPPEIERLRAALHDVAFFGKKLLRRIPPPPPETIGEYGDAWREAREAVHALPQQHYDTIKGMQGCGSGWDAALISDLDRIAPTNEPSAEWGEVISRLSLFYQNTLNSRELHSNSVDAILAENAKEESRRRERQRMEIEAGNRRTELLNAFNDLRNLGRESFHRETGEDPGIYELPGSIPPPPDSYWQWKASKIVEVCRSLRGWEGEFKEYSAATDLTNSQRVALTILQAGMDGDQDRIAKLLVDLTPGSDLAKQTHIEFWRGIPNALADIDRDKCAPVKEEPETSTNQQTEVALKKRPAYDRDHLFLEWYEEEGAATYRSHAEITKKWNEMPKVERQRDYPTSPNNVNRVTVIEAVKKATKERKSGVG